MFRLAARTSWRALLAGIALLGATDFASADDEALLERDVLPVLTKHCLACHGGLRQRGGLDMRTLESAKKGGKSGPALAAKDLAGSEMWKRIAADAMPPGDKKLSDAEKAVIKRWILDGLPTVAQKQQREAPLLKAGTKHPPAKIAAAVDQHIQRGLDHAKLTPSPLSDDAEFLRRVTIDLTGCVPTSESAKQFLDSTDPSKRAKLIDSLLATPEFGEQFGRTWREWICPPELPSDGNGGAQPYRESQAFGSWIGARVAAGDGWDKIVRDIVTVDGEIKNQPQVIFWGLVGEGSKPTPSGSARSIASLFMGVQIQCAECHDDPFRSWSQKDFWALSAFFHKVDGNFTKIFEAPNKNKAGTSKISIPSSAFKNVGTNVPATFLGGAEFKTSRDEPLRPPFAQWLTTKDNAYFSRAFVNRMWFYLFARGIVHPVDDFRDLNPPTNPALLDMLAEEFTASGFDIKHLFRGLCNSETYQRTSRVVPGTSEAAIDALTANFGRMPLRVMPAETLYNSLKQIYGDKELDLRGINPKDGNTLGQAATVGNAYLEFLRRFGTNEDDATDYTHGIPQMLTMINHPRLMSPSKALDAFRKKMPTEDETIEWLYLGSLSRRPTVDELAETRAYLKSAPDDYIGVLWTLVNRSEYILVR